MAVADNGGVYKVSVEGGGEGRGTGEACWRPRQRRLERGWVVRHGVDGHGGAAGN